ncbi:hypothetical protein AOLI_G00223970 [Acnodon oligacanthus]
MPRPMRLQGECDEKANFKASVSQCRSFNPDLFPSVCWRNILSRISSNPPNAHTEPEQRLKPKAAVSPQPTEQARTARPNLINPPPSTRVSPPDQHIRPALQTSGISAQDKCDKDQWL